MEINESVPCPNFGDPRSRDHKLGYKRIKKNAIFGLKIDSFDYNSKTTRRAKLKFVQKCLLFFFFFFSGYLLLTR